MERRLKFKSLKRVYSQKSKSFEKPQQNVGLQSLGSTPKKPPGKSLSLDWRIQLRSPESEPDPELSPTNILQRIDELDLSSSQHLCRSSTAPSVPLALTNGVVDEGVNSRSFTSTLITYPEEDKTKMSTPMSCSSQVLALKAAATTQMTGGKTPHRGLRRTKSRPEASDQHQRTGSISSGGGMGGTIKRYVSLLRSRSAISTRDRPMFGGSIGSSPDTKDTSFEKASCGDIHQDTTPPTSIQGARTTELPASQTTPNRLVNFFSKRSFKSKPLKRTKSVTKLDNINQVGGLGGLFNTGGYGSTEPLTLSFSPLRSSQSHESLLGSHDMLNTLDPPLGEVSVKPVHSSILGQDNCFQATSSAGTRFFRCRTAEERDLWVKRLHNAVNPNNRHMKRTENSAKVFILEAKGVSTKKKYFCEVLFDDCLYARTSTKSTSDICFWGEQFEFNRLPSLDTITVALYRDEERRRKKEKSIAVGTVSIPVIEVTSRCHNEKWYPVKSENNKNVTKESPTLRIKCQFQSVDILPMEVYADFLTYVKGHYAILCKLLEPCVSVKAKEDIATSLVYIMQREGLAKNFLADLVMLEIDRIDDAHLLFRGNSLATKAMEAYMKLVGVKYLSDTLRQVINKVVDEKLDCEVDPKKMAQISSIHKQQENLISIVRLTWSCILNSYPLFPVELRECFCLYRERLKACNKYYLTENLISASIFLRLLCPAILSPSLFNFTQEYPDERSSRNLTLIAKTIQTLANFSQFQGKENFMEFMNDFIETEQAQMRIFLKQISSPIEPNELRGSEYDGDIDVGKHLSLLHTLLSDALGKVSDADINGIYTKQLNTLHNILEEISIAKTKPIIDIVHRLSDKSSTKDVTPINEPKNGFEKSLEYQSLKKNIFHYNDPTFTRGIPEADIPPSPASYKSSPSISRSSTLPRNTNLKGSYRMPAINLNTTDDYVLCSALESDRPCLPNSLVHSSLGSETNDSAPTSVYTTAIQKRQHFKNQNGSFNKIKEDLQDPLITYGNGNCNNNYIREESSNTDQLENKKSLVKETDTKVNGSQTSISQISNISSSGYQSSSPVDSKISNYDSTNNCNNDRYNTNSSSSSSSNISTGIKASQQLGLTHLTLNEQIYNQKGDLALTELSPKTMSTFEGQHSHYHPLHKSASVHCNRNFSSSLGSSHSVGELTSQPPTASRVPLGLVQSSQNTQSSSSEDLGSLVYTPREVRFHNAPRTNPRCLPTGRKSFTPYHHHSTSDLMGPTNCGKKMNRRRLSIGSARRDQRLKYESESSSECEHTPPKPRIRSQRFSQRSSKTTSKTLDEYEQEILSMRSAMEIMHQKLVFAEEAIANETKTSNSDILRSQNLSKHSADLQNNCSNIEQMNFSNGSSSMSDSSSSSYKGISKHTQENSDSPPNITDINAATTPNDHMKELLTRLLAVQEEFELEKQKMRDLMSEKDAVINAQENHINALDQTNSKLLKALGQVNDIHLCPPKYLNTLEVLTSNQISDTSDYKSS